MSRGYSNFQKPYRSNNFSDIFNGEEQNTVLRTSHLGNQGDNTTIFGEK